MERCQYRKSIFFWIDIYFFADCEIRLHRLWLTAPIQPLWKHTGRPPATVLDWFHFLPSVLHCRGSKSDRKLMTGDALWPPPHPGTFESTMAQLIKVEMNEGGAWERTDRCPRLQTPPGNGCGDNATTELNANVLIREWDGLCQWEMTHEPAADGPNMHHQQVVRTRTGCHFGGKKTEGEKRLSRYVSAILLSITRWCQAHASVLQKNLSTDSSVFIDHGWSSY